VDVLEPGGEVRVLHVVERQSVVEVEGVDSGDAGRAEVCLRGVEEAGADVSPASVEEERPDAAGPLNGLAGS